VIASGRRDNIRPMLVKRRTAWGRKTYAGRAPRGVYRAYRNSRVIYVRTIDQHQHTDEHTTIYEIGDDGPSRRIGRSKNRCRANNNKKKKIVLFVSAAVLVRENVGLVACYGSGVRFYLVRLLFFFCSKRFYRDFPT